VNALTYRARCPHGTDVLWRASVRGDVPLCPPCHDPQPWHGRLLNLLRGYQ
jgi:hypothetical protein